MTYPKIAIIVPARNEQGYIGKLIESVINVDYPKENLILLICDGMSDDQTQSIVKDYANKYDFIKLVLNTEKTTPYAMNFGIKNSEDAEIIVTVSAHAEIAPDFFTKIVQIFDISPEIGCVGGVSQNVYLDDTSKPIGLAMSSMFGVGNAHFRTGDKEGFVDTVSFPAFRREVFEKIGLFNETLTRNQDDEFNFRIAKAGYKIFLTGKIRSKYYVRGTFKKLYKQYFQYGYWKVYVNKLHSTVTSARQLAPPLFVFFIFTGLIFAFFGLVFAIIYGSIWLLYIIAGLWFASKKSKNVGEIIKIVWCFFILHISYGLGYMKGIFDFFLLRKQPSARAGKLTR